MPQKLTDATLGLKQWLFRDVLNNEGFLAAIGTMDQNVMPDDEIAFIPGPGYEEAVLATCNPTYVEGSIAGGDKWKIADLGIYKSYCEDNIAAELKRGNAITNLSENQVAVKVFKHIMGNSLANSALCLGLFGDSTSQNTKLNPVDGIIKKVMAIATADQNRRTALTTNSKAAFKAAGEASDKLLTLIEDADPILRGAEDAEIIMTQATYDALNRDMMLNKGVNLDAQLNQLYGGMKETTWQGTRLVVIPAMDKIISSVANNPLSGKPIFALLTTKSNIKFGSRNNDQAGVGKVQIIEDKREDETLVKVKYSLGTHVCLPELVQVMY